MSTASPVTTATTIINTAMLVSSFEKVKNAYDHRDYDEIIRQATKTIAHIEQLELLLILEHRAHALSMKSKFGAAAQDAETMIKYAPTLPQGYLCFGKLLSMQGKQTRALKVYQEALEKVPTNGLAYGQLLQGKKMVDEKNNHHFDLVSALPLEVQDEIVNLLSEEEKSNLFDVSTTWSQWLENCQKAWKCIYDDLHLYEDIGISRVLSKIAKHVRHLIIATEHQEVWLRYLEHLENGDFRNLKTFAFTSHMFDYMSCKTSVMSLVNGFWKTRNTLTRIDFKFLKSPSLITITDILFYLPYLKTLTFYVKDSLADVLGELEALQEPHRSLVELQLDTSSTSGDALKPLTKWCPYVRRLILRGATPSALDIVTDYFPNVEMLGYNNDCQLPDLHEVLNQDYNNNEPIIPIITMNNMYAKQEQGRLRAFYSDESGRGVSGDEFLRLLQKNQKTLEIIHANMSMTEQQYQNGEPRDNFRPDYSRNAASIVLNLDRLRTLIFWPDIYGVYEPLFCRLVGPSLKYFKSVKTHNLSAVVDTLINSQQLLETVGFENVSGGSSEHDNTLAAQCLVRLFNHYAATSLPGPNKTKTPRNFIFNCCNCITDDVLDALANIKTIKGLSFRDLNGITCQGFKDFFIKLNKQNVQITNLILERMQYVMYNDTFFDIISTMEQLEALHLYYINWLRNDDIEKLIYTAKRLDTLVVLNCAVFYKNIKAIVDKSRRKFKYLKIIDYRDNQKIRDFGFDIFNQEN